MKHWHKSKKLEEVKDIKYFTDAELERSCVTPYEIAGYVVLFLLAILMRVLHVTPWAIIPLLAAVFAVRILFRPEGREHKGSHALLGHHGRL